MNEKLLSYTLNQVGRMLRDGEITEREATEYVRAWNAGPHFTQAVITVHGIKNFNPETGAYRSLWEKYGVRE